MWLEANRTVDPIAPVSLDVDPSFAEDAVSWGDDLPALRTLIAALPLPLIAKCRLLQMLSAQHRADAALERLDQLWQQHTLAARQAGLPARMDPLVACALAFRLAELDAEGTPDRARCAEAWHQAGRRAKLTVANHRWVADMVAADRALAPTGDATSIDHQARQWVFDLEAHGSQGAR